MGLLRRLFGNGAPDGFTGALELDETVIAATAVRGGGHLVVTSLGLWVPGPRRIGWHLISKVKWEGSLRVVEAAEASAEGPVVLLEDRPAHRFAVDDDPGRVLRAISQRVEGSIRARERVESPGVWIVQRKIPGRDGVVWQARGDAGVDLAAVRTAAAAFAERLTR
ncbi:hypothetical protein SAMN05216188_10473 [Lentzea xinjiangensis]|uniref:Uncharacterized protein n=1 Tax=Lentzea xinjiangensis TaxID=402600 RepID=A0A1H9HJV2_9PSEU|nr:hypothetical protein [Lentzea xinjiangensis]SEQ62629.1 hypothetical protein SAMN05216188_10473 [Lentzea xinjiangensis]